VSCTITSTALTAATVAELARENRHHLPAEDRQPAEWFHADGTREVSVVPAGVEHHPADANRRSAQSASVRMLEDMKDDGVVYVETGCAAAPMRGVHPETS